MRGVFIGVVTLLVICVCATALTFVLARSKSKASRDRVEAEAAEAIDYEQLEEPLAEFIELVKSHAVIDQPASNFKDVLNESSILSGDSNDATQTISFVLPTTPETNRRLKESHQVDSFPMLLVLVEKKTGRIQRVRLYVQSL